MVHLTGWPSGDFEEVRYQSVQCCNALSECNPVFSQSFKKKGLVDGLCFFSSQDMLIEAEMFSDALSESRRLLETDPASAGNHLAEVHLTKSRPFPIARSCLVCYIFNATLSGSMTMLSLSVSISSRNITTSVWLPLTGCAMLGAAWPFSVRACARVKGVSPMSVKASGSEPKFRRSCEHPKPSCRDLGDSYTLEEATPLTWYFLSQPGLTCFMQQMGATFLQLDPSSWCVVCSTCKCFSVQVKF